MEEPEPTAIAADSIEVSISNPESQKVMVLDVETKFSVDIEPSNIEGLVAEVTVYGDHGITCEPSEADTLWTWYCTGTQEAEAASIFVNVTGDFPDKSADYDVKVILPTPTPKPTEPPENPTPTSKDEEATKEPTKEPGGEEEATKEPTEEPEETETPSCSPSVRIPIDTMGNAPDIDVTAEITFPEDCADVPAATPTDVAGTYTGDIEGLEFWVFVYISGQHWPQSPDACQELPAQAASNNWLSTGTYIGAKGDEKQFELILTVTEFGGTASEEIKRWLRNGCNNGVWDPYISGTLPEGLMELDSVTVKTTG